MDGERIISFLDEKDASREPALFKPLKVLTVDDDPIFQQSTSFALANVKVLGQNIELVQAFSFAEAYDLLLQNSDIAIALVDVVMETEDAGLRLVKAVREAIGNNEIRLILVTGQPGTAPIRSVMQIFDINDYWTKSELTKERLKTILTSNSRAFEQIKEIEQSKKALESIVTASRTLYSLHELPTLTNCLIEELSQIFNIGNEGFVYTFSETNINSATRSGLVIGATKKFSGYIQQSLQKIESKRIREQIHKCLKQEKSFIDKSEIYAYLPKSLAGADYVCYVESGRKLSPTESKLLQVFCMNACGSLNNVTLINKLDKLAYEDEFLRLPNKNTLLKRINEIIHSKNQYAYHLVVIDIDNFSSINTVMGVNQGDAILRFIAHRLRDCSTKEVLVARIKDDIFALLGPIEHISVKDIKSLFKHINEHNEAFNTINFSSVTYPLAIPASSAQSILTQTSIALKNAKLKGINQHVVYQLEDDSKAKYRFQLLQSLQKAIENDEIFIALQPQVEIKTGTIKGVEALARWTLKDGTVVSPEEFIPLAETTGLILLLGKQIIDKSCAAAKELTNIGYQHLKVGINMSIIQFERDDVVEYLQAAIKKNNISSEEIEVEATESLAMQNFSVIYDHFQILRNLGVRIAIDDFGTGFSSLSCLSQLPADRLKIDKSFIERMTFDNRAKSIVRIIIELGKRFNMQTIAEGVESTEQLDILKNMNCDEVQGYYYAKPMPLTQLIEWLKKNHPLKIK
ncbi:bifunctional diguanylate cyclase/phosphodiesterase [Aliikangiella sp. IMCC44359]|uniref:bifunctional diguanylate cyclase/phosphodiesterase n=1 Tax=Aliikangiella sp. IMCC44359 TaxID=3459125 RepID=UPI00403A84F2